VSGRIAWRDLTTDLPLSQLPVNVTNEPLDWTEGHHIRSWPTGGVTEPANGCLVCRHHHRLLHNNSGWQVRMASDGHPEFLPPATIDPERRPRRNIYHRRD
jgi:hypothetical protein